MRTRLDARSISRPRASQRNDTVGLHLSGRTTTRPSTIHACNRLPALPPRGPECTSQKHSFGPSWETKRGAILVCRPSHSRLCQAVGGCGRSHILWMLQIYDLRRGRVRPVLMYSLINNSAGRPSGRRPQHDVQALDPFLRRIISQAQDAPH